MAEDDRDELSVEELEDVAGGDTNNGCTINTNCTSGCVVEPVG